MGSSFDRVVNRNYRNLSDIDVQILQTVADDLSAVQELSISALAEQCNVSPSTILRMTRHLGFSGYSDFKYFLRHETGRRTGLPGQSFDAGAPVRVALEDIAQTARHFQKSAQLNEIYARIRDARKIYAFGTGYGQRLMLEDFSRCMQLIGIDVIQIPAVGELRLIKQHMRKDDLLIIASLSGCIDRFRDVFQAINIIGTTVVSITNLDNNELASFTDYSLYFQNSIMLDDLNVSSSTFVTLHLVLHLLIEGYKEWLLQREGE